MMKMMMAHTAAQASSVPSSDDHLSITLRHQQCTRMRQRNYCSLRQSCVHEQRKRYQEKENLLAERQSL